MKVLKAYVGNAVENWVILDKDVQALQEENIVTDLVKLQKKFDKENERIENVYGVVDGKILSITLFNDGKWSGMIWSTRTRLSGTYKRM